MADASNHVAIEHLWNFSRKQIAFEPSEGEHLLKCPLCIDALGLCLLSRSANDVKQQLEEIYGANDDAGTTLEDDVEDPERLAG